ncbi:MAG TPA: hypothetical protein VF866_01165 [Xanthobacteraceae bacterium]
MSSESEYRRWAAASLDLAKRAAMLADKTRLLVIAEAWLELADRIGRARSRRAARRTIGDAPAAHPLVTSALGSDHPDAPRAAPSGRLDSSSPRSN